MINISGDESIIKDDSDESDDDKVLSGDFINDGSFTQAEPLGNESQHAMYFAINKKFMDLQSPDDFIDGEFNIRNIVRPVRNDNYNIQDSQDQFDTSFISNNQSIEKPKTNKLCKNNDNNNYDVENINPKQNSKKIANPFKYSSSEDSD